ncbi:MAG: glycosyltransferase family 39 protein [Oscillospiraceae bacterium]|nr:glycosyltransferase family 39 protein [Oscillospiraceae bacterium]
MNKLTLAFPIALILFLVMILVEYIQVVNKDNVGRRPDRRFSRLDAFCLAIVTIAYAVTAFVGLGDSTAPQKFCKFQSRGQYSLIELDEEKDIGAVMYYSGFHTGKYYLQFSADGEEFTDIAVMEQNYADLFKWQYAELGEETQGVKYIRIIADGELWLGELAVYDSNGFVISKDEITCTDGGKRLFDEADTVPEEPTYLNSTYFDEIYHARTALEHIENIYPYEVSHPPLGKLILSIGIHLFGMTPFGWRFMGALFGVAMVPALYLFLKKMFGGSAVPTAATTIFAFDFMHFTQTRIATIDTYGVFFTILMYLFMYIYLQTDRDDDRIPRRKWLVPLALSGLCFGLGAASKWTCLYAGAGLAVLWLIDRVERGAALIRAGQKRRCWRATAGNIAWCILFFVVVPAVIYYCSYYPYGTAKGMKGISMLFSREYADIVLSNQKFMFTYHNGVTSEHPYASRWWQWILDIRPILYYLEYGEGTKSSFGAFVSPLLCWGGLAAMVIMFFRWLAKGDKKARFIFLGYLAQLVPWMLIGRVTFFYHYFPCTVFLALALGHIFNTFRCKTLEWKRTLISVTVVSLVLFAAFYPAISGVEAPREYFTNFLKWLPRWPF